MVAHGRLPSPAHSTYTIIQLIFTSQDISRFMTINLEVHLLILNFFGSHLRIRTNLYFCTKLIGRYSFNEKIEFPK